VLVISDRDGREPLTADPEAPISASAEGVVVRVRHAQDVENLDDGEAEVSVEVFEGEVTGHVSVSCELAIASGVLVIGDADAMDEVNVEPGRWKVSVALDQAEAAETVRIGLSPRR
jgi:hypothetical protein